MGECAELQLGAELMMAGDVSASARGSTRTPWWVRLRIRMMQAMHFLF